MEVQALYPRLHSLQAKVTQHTGDVVNKSLANERLDLLARLAANAEAWYESVLGQEAAVDHGCWPKDDPDLNCFQQMDLWETEGIYSTVLHRGLGCSDLQHITEKLFLRENIARGKSAKEALVS